MEIKYSHRARIDDFSDEELREIVAKSSSWRGLARNLGYKSFGKSSEKAVKQRLTDKNISTDHFVSSHAPLKRNAENSLVKDTTASDQTVKRYYLLGEYTPYVCSICGQEPFWQGKELVLTLDHINGDHRDSRPENLRWVCPNCDRQLDTFAGRNHHRYDD